MQRVTISIDDQLAQAFDALWEAQGYQNRSEAVRDLIRESVERRRVEAEPGGHCVASLSYVYDHHARDLAGRLIDIQHASHDLVIATTHVHLDHGTCLETTLLKGEIGRVRALADAIRAERGVRFGEINLIGVTPNDTHRGDMHGAHHHAGRAHYSPHKG